MKASVKYQVVYHHREKYGIGDMCRFFGVSRSGYYDFVRRLGLVTLAVLSVVAGLWSASFALHVDLNAIFGTSCEVIAKAAARSGDSIEIGWSLNPYHAYGACVRLFFPFLFGMFLARTGWKIRIPRGGLPICLAVFLLVLCCWQARERRSRRDGRRRRARSSRSSPTPSTCRTTPS